VMQPSSPKRVGPRRGGRSQKVACGRDDLALVAAQGERRAHQFETSERDDILDRSTLDRHGSPEDTFLGGTDPRSRPTLEASRADRHAGRETCQRRGGRHGSTKRKALQGQVSGREGISDQPPCPPWSRYQLPGGYWLSGTGTDRAAACRLICYSGNRNCPDCLGKLALYPALVRHRSAIALISAPAP